MQWHEDLHSGKHLSTVVDLARKATGLRPDIANNWCMLASFLMQAGEDEQATAVLTEAISKLPPDPRLHEMLARANHSIPRIDPSRGVLEGAATVTINGRETAISRFEPSAESRFADDEAQVATDTLALDPVNSDALSILARVSRNNGQPQVIVPFCRAALERDRGHTRARYELAV